MTATPVTHAHEVADELFERNAAVFGRDLPIYRGHVHRVIGLVGLQCDVPKAVAGPLGLAAFFHDAGIWFDGTWDYLPPSVRRAVAELEGSDDAPYSDLVASLINEHHRLRPALAEDPLVEAFRRADLVDVTGGLIAPGVSREQYRTLVEQYPPRGFRPMLLKAFGRGLREKPWNPMPMVKF